jgi:hypothetical protein
LFDKKSWKSDHKHENLLEDLGPKFNIFIEEEMCGIDDDEILTIHEMGKGTSYKKPKEEKRITILKKRGKEKD